MLVSGDSRSRHSDVPTSGSSASLWKINCTSSSKFRGCSDHMGQSFVGLSPSSQPASARFSGIHENEPCRSSCGRMLQSHVPGGRLQSFHRRLYASPEAREVFDAVRSLRIAGNCVSPDKSRRVCQARANSRCVSASGFPCWRHVVNNRATFLRAQMHRGLGLLDTPCSQFRFRGKSVPNFPGRGLSIRIPGRRPS